MGELGFLGLSYPEEYGGQGGDYYANLVLAEEMVHSNSGGLAMGVAVHTDMATPPVYLFGTEEQKQEYLVPSIRGEKISCLGITEPDAGLGRVRHQDARRPRRRRVGHQRLEDLHHERPAGRLHRARHEDRPRRRLRRLHALPRGHGRAGRDPREEAREARDARLGHRAAGVPGRARARGRGARPGGQGLLPHHVGAPGRAADRRRGLRRRGAEGASTARSQYAGERNAFGRPIGKFQAIRHKFAEMATKIEAGAPDGLHDGLALPERRVPRARDLDGEALHGADGRARWWTSASRSTAAPAT